LVDLGGDVLGIAFFISGGIHGEIERKREKREGK
jgi:hypothetical protein